MSALRRSASGARHHSPSRDRWLVSYADFITLLFAFFATMYAISSVDAQKLSAVAKGMQAAFDDAKAKPSGRGVLPEHLSLVPEQPEDSTKAIEQAVNEDLSQELADERLEVIVDRRGVTLSIPEAGAFGTGRDELSGTAQQLVTRVATTLGRFGNAVRVEGHTDDIPIHTVRFQSNWDLSAARASRVVEFLISHGLEPERLSATGYGEFHPRVPNISAAGRASNRRIDLVILNSQTTSAEEPVTTGAVR